MQRARRHVASRLEPLWHFRRADCDIVIHLLEPALPITFAFSLIWWIFQPAPFALTVMVFTGSLLLLSYAWALTMARQVSGERALRFTAVQVGDHLEEVLSLTNLSPLPVAFAEFVDHSGMPGYSINAVRVGRPRTIERWTLRTTCRRRGVYPLGHWEIRLGDPFGLFEVRQVYRQAVEITVYPPLAPMPRRIARQRRTMGDRLPLRLPLPAETVSALATRPYVHGDAVRRIHWRSSARYGDLFVKTFQPEASSVLWLLPDLDAEVQVGTGDESSLEKMIIVTASMASQLLGEHRAVGLMMEPQVVPPLAGRARLWPILRSLAAAQTTRTSLAEMLTRASAIVSVNDSAVILTPSLDPDWTKRLHSLTGGTQNGLEVVLLDPTSFGGRGNTAAFARLLRNQGIPTHVLHGQEIQPVLGAYGRVHRWSFRTLSTGRVVLQQTPRSAGPGMP
jgi:uncharacterized protein (DUF58 family)